MDELGKLNERLALWAGWEEHKQSVESGTGWRSWIPPLADNVIYLDPPDFTSSLDACFKWLVPRLDIRDIHLQEDEDGWQCDIYGGEYWAIAETPALALCRAIEKLIGGEK